MPDRKIAVIGDASSVMIFKAIGLDVFCETESASIERRVHALAQAQYAVIYITEEAQRIAQDAVNYYAAATLPAIIPIPSCRGTLGLGRAELKANVEKAVGIDILAKKGDTGN